MCCAKGAILCVRLSILCASARTLIKGDTAVFIPEPKGILRVSSWGIRAVSWIVLPQDGLQQRGEFRG
jgi:hypothetical protein